MGSREATWVSAAVSSPECSYQRDEIYTALVYISRLLSVFMQKSKQEERMGQNQRQLEGSLKQSEQKADTAYEILDAISSGVVHFEDAFL